MRNLLVVVISLCLLAIQMVEADVATITAGMVSDNTITIDASLNEWNLSRFGDENKIVLNKDTASSVGGNPDAEVVIYAAYDSDNLYLGVEVIDDITYAEKTGDTIWQNDGMEIWIDGSNNAGAFPGEEDNFQIVTDSNGAKYGYRNDNVNALVDVVENAAERDGTNYKLEVKIPLDAIVGLDMGNGMGFNITIVDADGAQAAGGWQRLFWQAQTDVDTANWGDLLFGEPVSVKPMGGLTTTWAQMKI